MKRIRRALAFLSANQEQREGSSRMGKMDPILVTALELIFAAVGSILCAICLVVTIQLVTQCARQRIEHSLRQLSPLWFDPSGN